MDKKWLASECVVRILVGTYLLSEDFTDVQPYGKLVLRLEFPLDGTDMDLTSEGLVNCIIFYKGE